MKTIRIVPEIPDEGKMALSSGTKVFMGDTELKGITSIVTTFEADEPVRAVVNLYVAQDETDGIPTFHSNHPISGEWKEIKRIEFADGSAWEAGCVSSYKLPPPPPPIDVTGCGRFSMGWFARAFK